MKLVALYAMYDLFAIQSSSLQFYWGPQGRLDIDCPRLNLINVTEARIGTYGTTCKVYVHCS